MHSLERAELQLEPGRGAPRAQVKCCECGYESNTLETFLFLSLEVTRAASVERALQRFTSCETLDFENKYRCPRQVRRRPRRPAYGRVESIG